MIRHQPSSFEQELDSILTALEEAYGVNFSDTAPPRPP